MDKIKTEINKESLVEMKRINSEIQLRKEYEIFLKSIKTRYHLTVSFSYGMHETKSESCLNMLMKFMNRAILKKRYGKNNQFIEGIAIKESTFGMENIHYHILIADKENKLPSKDRMEQLIEKKIRLVNGRQSSLNKITKFHLQDYYAGDENSSLEKYLTKLFEKPGKSIAEKIDCFYPLSLSGIDSTY
ncbi:hypothetical protein [Halomonas sp. SCS19]|uniref:hypothetical protein n=1 Tax=Halomonas sp. SCS19 TaxID=2950870 RepID=UPI0032DFAF8A